MATIEVNAFLSISKYTNLIPGSISTVGELSKLGMSYAKDMNHFSLSADLTLSTLQCLSIVGQTESQYTLVEADKTNLKAKLEWYYNRMESATALASVADMISAFKLQFADVVTCNFEFPLISDGTSKNYYTRLEYSITSGSDTKIYQVWCAQSTLTNTYHRTQYQVVPMLQDLNLYHAASSLVAGYISASDPYGHVSRVQAEIGNYPPTGTEWAEYNYHYASPSTVKIPVKWAVIYYGNKYDAESLKQAISKHILANSSRTLNEWKAIFPDIFTNTRFFMNPLWSEFAINNQQVGQTGIYKNNFTFGELVDLSLSLYSGYTQADSEYTESNIRLNTHYMPLSYNNLGLLTLASKNNETSKSALNKVFTDIVNTVSGNVNANGDFNRMSVSTQVFLNRLYSALLVAETMTGSSALPAPFYKVNVQSKQWLAFSYQGVEYLLKPKANLV